MRPGTSSDRTEEDESTEVESNQHNKKRKRLLDTEDALTKIANAVAVPIPQLELPPPPVEGPMDGFANFVKVSLEQLGPKARNEAMFKIHEILYYAALNKRK